MNAPNTKVDELRSKFDEIVAADFPNYQPAERARVAEYAVFGAALIVGLVVMTLVYRALWGSLAGLPL